MKSSDLDKKFDDDREDILQHFDLSSAQRINQKQKESTSTFPNGLYTLSIEKPAGLALRGSLL